MIARAAVNGGRSVLVVVDDASMGGWLTLLLDSHGYRVVTAASGIEALEKMRRCPPVALIADVHMSGMSAYEFVSRVRASSEVPILLMSEESEAPFKVAGFECGADDYLVKPFDGAELVARVNVHVRRTERLTALSSQAHVDELTGLLNRRGFLFASERALSLARRRRCAVSLLLLDLDNFQIVNDSLGHHAGDVALRHIAQVLRKETRIEDIVGRWGGDEFVVLMPDTDAPAAECVASRIRIALGRCTYEGTYLRVGASIGAASSGGELSIEAMLSTADARMCESKRNTPSLSSGSHLAL